MKTTCSGLHPFGFSITRQAVHWDHGLQPICTDVVQPHRSCSSSSLAFHTPTSLIILTYSISLNPCTDTKRHSLSEDIGPLFSTEISHFSKMTTIPLDLPDRPPTIHDYVREGSLQEVKECLLAGVNPNLLDVNGWPPLFAAAGMVIPVPNSLEVAQLLLDHGADKEFTSSEGDTPLFRATDAERVPLIQLFIDLGVNLDVRNNLGKTPLRVAAGERTTLATKLLLEAGADQHIIDDDGQTPYEAASYEEQRKVFDRFNRTPPSPQVSHQEKMQQQPYGS